MNEGQKSTISSKLLTKDELAWFKRHVDSGLNREYVTMETMEALPKFLATIDHLVDAIDKQKRNEEVIRTLQTEVERVTRELKQERYRPPPRQGGDQYD